MHSDIVNLRQFYSSRLGRRVNQLLRQHVDTSDIAENAAIAGFGYAIPLLRALERAGARVAALMPRSMGAIYWPVHAGNRSLLGDPLRPPFAVNSLQCLVLLHAFEHEPRPDELLSVCWQLLSPGGRLLLIVPNRRGLWASFGATPFTTGVPYTVSQVKELLAAAEFTLRDVSAALFAPPSAHPFWQRMSGPMEWLGRMICPRFGGVLVIDVEKQIYAGLGIPAVAARRAPATAWATPAGATRTHTA